MVYYGIILLHLIIQVKLTVRETSGEEFLDLVIWKNGFFVIKSLK